MSQSPDRPPAPASPLPAVRPVAPPPRHERWSNTTIWLKERGTIDLHLKGEERQRLHRDFVAGAGRDTYTAYDRDDHAYPVSLDLRDVAYITD